MRPVGWGWGGYNPEHLVGRRDRREWGTDLERQNRCGCRDAVCMACGVAGCCGIFCQKTSPLFKVVKLGHLPRNDGARVREIWVAWRMLEIAALENGRVGRAENKIFLNARQQ